MTPHDELSDADITTRADVLQTQIESILTHAGVPGRLPDYLVSPHPQVREAVARYFTNAGYEVDQGFDAKDGAWMTIMRPDEGDDDSEEGSSGNDRSNSDHGTGHAQANSGSRATSAERGPSATSQDEIDALANTEPMQQYEPARA